MTLSKSALVFNELRNWVPFLFPAQGFPMRAIRTSAGLSPTHLVVVPWRNQSPAPTGTAVSCGINSEISWICSSAYWPDSINSVRIVVIFSWTQCLIGLGPSDFCCKYMSETWTAKGARSGKSSSTSSAYWRSTSSSTASAAGGVNALIAFSTLSPDDNRGDYILEKLSL